MYVYVKLLNGFPEPLLYTVPATLTDTIFVGSIVRVPLRAMQTAAVVQETHHTLSKKPAFAIKDIVGLEPFPNDPHYHTFLNQLAHYYQIDEIHFIKRVRQFLHAKEIQDPTAELIEVIPAQSVTLTDEQQIVCDALSPLIKNPRYAPTVLHGVTGSGKTEIYKNLITECITNNKSVLLLLPEVTLALQFERLLRHQLGSMPIFGFHSASGQREKRILWQRLVQEQPSLIIGVHLPVLLPIAHLGCIIIDEEHECGYQEKKHPKINSKEAAIMRANIAKIPILLGSATPSVSSLYNVTAKNWQFFQLKKRFSGALPTIKTVFLTDKKHRRNFWISQQLENEIRDRLAKKQQTIIFLNRRGYSFFVQCKNCSFVFKCKNCSVSLTLHDDNVLSCHYCGSKKTKPSTCPECKAGEDALLKKGIGTQQVVTILEKLFPHAHIGRADMDTTTKKKLWQQTLHDFEQGTLDILVGTQTIAKGFHFPNVTLVGVLWADLNLHFPMYNASETTLQQLIQVAGRAGRHHNESTVIIQAMIDHPVFHHLNEIDYLSFYQSELQDRTDVGYPPCARLVEIELKNGNEKLIDQEAAAIGTILMRNNTQNKIRILGPTKPPVHTIQRTHIRKIYLKGNNINDITKLFASIAGKKYTSSIFFTPNPIT
jgi:primosomal protein N' (replication factor Y)